MTQTDPSSTTTYTWDARNRWVGITGPSVSASFAYDALGRRIMKQVLSTVEGPITSMTTTYHYDGLDAIRESGPAGEASYLRTLAIDEALARNHDTFLLADALGSTAALTDPTGTPISEYAYSPFGETSIAGAPSPNPFQYTGRENDGTGLYYYRARYYHPGQGRFIMEDPIGLLGGNANFYAYPRLNPLSFSDPLGLAEFLGRGIASYYHPSLAGRPTRSGQPYDPEALTGASRDLPLGTIVDVRRDGKSVEGLINDRGPWHTDQEGIYDRIIDLSARAFRELAGSTAPGLIEVELYRSGYQEITKPSRGSRKERTARIPGPREKLPAPDPLAPLGPFAP